MMTAGALNTTGLTPGIHVPKWNKTPLPVPQWLKTLERDVKTSFEFSHTPDATCPLRILGANTAIDGRRVQSSLATGLCPKTDTREITNLTLRGVYSPSTNKSIEALPLRPAMARAKQVPGRYFPKAILSDEQKAALASVKPKKSATVQKDRFPPIKGLEFMKTSVSLLPPANRTRNVHTASYNPKIAQTRKSLRVFPEVQTEVFAICFQEARGGYDPDSELHSDYYSIKRVNINSAKDVHSNKAQVRVPTSDGGDFRCVLRGQRKRLHGRADDKDDDDDICDTREVTDDRNSRTKDSEVELPQISAKP